MCADTAIKNNLSRAMAVILVGGGCLGWLGGRVVDYTFDDVRLNSEFRISKEVEDAYTKTLRQCGFLGSPSTRYISIPTGSA